MCSIWVRKKLESSIVLLLKDPFVLDFFIYCGSRCMIIVYITFDDKLYEGEGLGFVISSSISRTLILVQ